MQNDNMQNEKLEKKYTLQKASLGIFATGAAIAAIIAGLRGCSAFEEKLAAGDIEISTDRDRTKEEISTEISSTYVEETSEISSLEEISATEESSTSFVTSEEELASSKDKQYVKTKKKPVQESETVVEEMSDTEPTSAVEESQVEKTSEPESSSTPSSTPSGSEDENKEDDDDKKKGHKHDYTIVVEEKVNAIDEEHHERIVKLKCKKCSKTTIEKKKEACNFSDFKSIGVDGEQASCAICTNKKTRNHDLTQTTTCVDDGNGKHTETKKETCNTCDYEVLLFQNTSIHHLSGFQNAGEVGEENHCDACDYVDKRNHTKTTNVSYEPGEQHIHTVLSNTTCSTCDYTSEKTEQENCVHEIFVSGGQEYEVSTCPKCEDEKTKPHDWNYEEFITTYVSKNDGTHVERIIYDCNTNTCDEKLFDDKLENCVGTWVSEGKIGETMDCDLCENTQKRDHSLENETEIKDNHNGTHTKEERGICTTCDYEEVLSVNTENHKSTHLWQNNGEAGEKNSCDDCAAEMTRSHATTQETKHIDDKNGLTHTDVVVNVCGTCDYEKEISKTVAHHMATSPWQNNGETGEKNSCDDCAAEMTRNHTMGAISDTGNYTYVGNKQHTKGQVQSCTTCDYTHSLDGELENCNLTGPENTKEDGKTIYVSCPDCFHEEIVHTHSFSDPIYTPNTLDSHNVTTLCLEPRDGGACSYSSTVQGEHHWTIETGRENTWDHPAEKEVECEDCHDLNWVPIDTKIFSNPINEEEIEEIPSELEPETEVVVPTESEEIPSSEETENKEEENEVEASTEMPSVEPSEEVGAEETTVTEETESINEEEIPVQTEVEEEEELEVATEVVIEEPDVQPQPPEQEQPSTTHEEAIEQVIEEIAREVVQQNTVEEEKKEQQEEPRKSRTEEVVALLVNKQKILEKSLISVYNKDRFYC